MKKLHKIINSSLIAFALSCATNSALADEGKVFYFSDIQSISSSVTKQQCAQLFGPTRTTSGRDKSPNSNHFTPVFITKFNTITALSTVNRQKNGSTITKTMKGTSNISFDNGKSFKKAPINVDLTINTTKLLGQGNTHGSMNIDNACTAVFSDFAH